MALNQWRKFAFFDKKLLRKENGEASDILQPFKIFASTSGRGKMIFGDADGLIIVMDQKLNLFTFRAYMYRVTHLSMTKQQNVLVSIGDDEEGTGATLKVWNFDKLEAGGIPTCARIIQISSKSAPDPVTCFAVHENLNYLAVGFSSGAVLLYKGDITKERNSAKPTVIHEAGSPITGLSFRPTTTHKGGIILFMSSLDEVWSYMFGSKDKENKVVLDHHGCGRNGSTMTDSSADYQFVIGRSDAFYFYLPDNRGQCLAFSGEKVLLEWSHGYLLVISRKEDGETSRTSLADSAAGEMQIITIYDVRNKLIAYYGPIPEVKAVLCEWGSIFILCDDNRIFQIREKELLQKLDMLFKKNMYSLAISLAKAQQYDQDSLIDMFRRYADHLYAKGDFDEAMIQYIKTIGRLEPSYVIRQFLDAQRIHNLTSYLKALHESNLASEDHTTLLLNCYTKLKDVEQLDKFVMSRNTGQVVNFDVETAIRVLRQSGYFRHALHLAELHEKHDWYLKIQLEDNKNYEDALEYIAKLDVESCEANLKTYGKVLMTNSPEETTKLLQVLCTSPDADRHRNSQDVEEMSPFSDEKYVNPEDFFHIFVTHPKEMREFLEYVVEHQDSPAGSLYHSLLELYLEAFKRTTDEKERSSLEQKAMRLLRESVTDQTSSLMVCQMNSFAPGILYLYEQKGMYGDILQFAIDQKNFDQAMDTCRRFGEKDSHLWVQTFWFLARNFGEYDKSLLQEALQVIEMRTLIPPLLVVDILAKNPNATLDVVRDYIIRRMQLDERKIKEDDQQVKAYYEKTSKLRAQVEDIRTNAQTFQDANCSACEKSLELPSVHFLCRHSYHQHCFESYADTDECPVCKPENRKLLDEIRAQEQNTDVSAQFFTRLDKEGFSVVADYFGKGLFGSQVSIDDLVKPFTANL